MNNQELLQLRKDNVPKGIVTTFPIFVDRAKNAEVWDVEGKRYIDMAGGIGALNTGHCHPKITAAVKQQTDRVMHTAFQVAGYEPYIQLCKSLNHMAPIDGDAKTILFTSGSEATDNSIKFARAFTKRQAVIAFSGAFHGRTMMALAMTGKVVPYRHGLGPVMPEVYHAPFPMALHGISPSDSFKAIERLFKSDVEPSQVAAICLEPVQGEGGFYIAPKEWLQDLRKICDTHGILLIADEVQAGFARTGKFFSIEHSGVSPDIITCAKSLAGGMPLSAVIGRKDIMDSIEPGALGGTYGGNPLGCASALAVIDVIHEEKLLERSQMIGAKISERLQSMQKKHSQIAEIRSLGAMIALELFTEQGQPATELVAKISQECLQRGLIILPCGYYGNVHRFLVPLTATDENINEGLSIFEGTLADYLS